VIFFQTIIMQKEKSLTFTSYPNLELDPILFTLIRSKTRPQL